MYKDITASLVAATRKVVEASSIKAANEAAQKEQSSALSKSMRPAYEGSAPRNAQEISLLREKAHTVPKTPKEKSLAAMAEPKDKITHADVMTGRGVKKEEVETVEEDFTPLAGVKINHPKHGEGTIAGYTRPGLYKVNYKSGKDADHSSSELEKHHDPDSMKKVAQASKDKFKRVISKEEVEQVDETIVNGKIVNNKIYKPGGDKPAKKTDAFDYKSPRKPQDAPNRKHGDVTSTGHDVKKVSTGMVYTKRFEENEVEAETIAEAPVDGVAPGSMEGDKHMCASKVMHKEWKEGKTVFSQHAEPNEIGLIEWYDVMFDHGIEKKVPTRDLEIMVSESHMSHSKKKKM